MDLSWQLLRKLEEAYGDSFYILDLQRFRQNYHEFLKVFRSIYPKSNIAYSYKTNYTPKICQTVKNLGGYAEVVSGMEYTLARELGVPPQRIIFNGPCKREADLEEALLAGSTVNLDSFHEVELVESIARRAPDHIITVGLRCNIELPLERISRFGFDVEGEEFPLAFETLSRLPNCRIAGLHCHIATRDKSAGSYELRTQKMLALTADYFGENHPEFINIGGGFYGKMPPELQEQFHQKKLTVPTYQQYATAIATEVRKKFPFTLNQRK